MQSIVRPSTSVRYLKGMDALALIIGFSWTLAGLLCLTLSVSLAVGRVPRNALYGFRVRESLASDNAWFAINRFAGKRAAICSFATIGWGVVVCFMPLAGNEALALFLGLAPLAFVGIPCLQTWRFAKRWTT